MIAASWAMREKKGKRYGKPTPPMKLTNLSEAGPRDRSLQRERKRNTISRPAQGWSSVARIRGSRRPSFPGRARIKRAANDRHHTLALKSEARRPLPQARQMNQHAGDEKARKELPEPLSSRTTQ